MKRLLLSVMCLALVTAGSISWGQLRSTGLVAVTAETELSGQPERALLEDHQPSAAIDDESATAELRQRYLELLSEKVKRMTTEELEAALQEATREMQEVQGARQMLEIRTQLEEIIEGFQGTEAARQAREMLNHHTERRLDISHETPFFPQAVRQL